MFNQQRIQMGTTENLILKQDVVTRWNSTLYMFERCFMSKPALISIIAISPDVNIEFSQKEWEIMEKVMKSLKIFEEATKILSKN